jgi:hypothetical protein
MDTREQRGLALAALYRIERGEDGKWVVPSQSGNGTKYIVDADEDPSKQHCTCPDHRDRGVKCKHMFAVEFVLTRERNPDGTETVTKTSKVVEKVTYKQDWPNYNKARSNDRRPRQGTTACHESPKSVKQDLPRRPRFSRSRGYGRGKVSRSKGPDGCQCLRAPPQAP